MLRRLLQKPILWLVVAGLLLVAGLASLLEIRLPPRSRGDLSDLLALRDREDVNVLFILIDTLRADHLSLYGYERPTTPFLDEVARYGIRFETVRAQSSWTKTSMASLWTARFPARTGVFDHSHVLPDQLPVGAEALQKGGFRTVGIYRNNWLTTNFGFGRGFDVYIQPVPSTKRHRFQRAERADHQLPGTDLDVLDAAVEFYRTHPNQRSFVYLHLMDAHQYLFEQQSALFGVNLMDSYDNAIHWTDRVLSALFKELADLDLLRRTLVVIASDHGEAFREHRTEGHARNLYREVSEVPLLISPPFNLDEPIVVREMVRNVDIVPTLLDLVGLPPLPDADGISLVPLIEAAAQGRPADGAAPARDMALLDRAWPDLDAPPQITQSITADGWRLMYADCLEDGIELYDVTADPGETRNLATEEPERTAALRAELEDHFASAVGATSTRSVQIDALQIQRLRALGYVIGAPKPGGEPSASQLGCQLPGLGGELASGS
jgi:arylsulfatase A-like enzyme